MKNKRNNLAADISYIALLLLLFVCIVYIAGELRSAVKFTFG